MSAEESSRADPGPAVDESPRQIEERNIRNLYLETCFRGLISAGVGSFIGIFLARLGASSFEIGMLTALPSLVAIFVTIPAASLIEGRRDLVRIANLSALASWSGCLLLALVPVLLQGARATAAPMAVVLVWTLATMLGAAFNPAWTTVYAEVVPPRRRPSVNGGRWALMSIASALAVAVYGKSLDVIPFPLNFQVVFLASFLSALGSIYFFGKMTVSEESHAPALPRARGWRQLSKLPRAVAQQPSFLRYMGGAMVIRLGMYIPVAIGPLFWVRELQSPNTWIGLSGMVTNATLVVAYWAWGRFASRSGHEKVLLVSCAGLSLSPILTFFVPTPELMMPVAVVSGFFSGGLTVSFFEAFMTTCPPDQRPTFTAIDTVSAHLAAVVGPLLGTGLAVWLGIRPVFLVAGGVLLVGTGLFYALIFSARPSPGQGPVPPTPVEGPVI